MPVRMIREGILTSETVCQLTWAEEVFYRRLLNVADDYGLYDARPIILRTKLYPLQLAVVSDRDIQGYHQRCVELGLVKVYQVSGHVYGQVLKFGQQAKGKPKCPIPPGANPLDFMPEKERRKLLQVTPSYSELPRVTQSNSKLLGVTASYLDVNEDVNVDVVENSINKQHLSKASLLSARDAAENVALQDTSQGSPDTPLVEAALGMGSGTPPKAPPRESSAHVGAIPTAAEVEGVMQSLALEPLRNKKALAECAACFIDAHEARGWCDPRGIPIRNWQPAARNFARSYAKNQSSRTSTNQPQKRKDCNDPERYR